MEVLIKSKRSPFNFLSEDDTIRCVSYSEYRKYRTNDENKIKKINEEVNHLLDLFFTGNLPESQYIYIIRLCNIFNPHYLKTTQFGRYDQNIVFADYHCYDCTTRDYHVRMIEIHQKRKHFKDYLDWYVYTDNMTKRVVNPDFNGYCDNSRRDKFDLLRLLTEVLSNIFFNLTKIRDMFTVKMLILNRLEFYLRDKTYLDIDYSIINDITRNNNYRNGYLCFLNNELIDYLQEIYGDGGMYERMIELMQKDDIQNFYRIDDIYRKSEIIEKFKLINNLRELNYDENSIPEEQKEKMIKIIESFLKGKGQKKYLHGLNKLFNHHINWNTNFNCLKDYFEYENYDFGSLENKKNQIIKIFDEFNLPPIYDELFGYINLNKNEKNILGERYFNFLYELFLIFKRGIPNLNDSSKIYFLYILQKYIHFKTLMQLKLIYSTHCFFQLVHYPDMEMDIIRF